MCHVCGDLKIKVATLSGSPESSNELDVTWHESHSPSVDGTQVGIGEKMNNVGLAGLLQTLNRRLLPPEVDT